MIKEMIIVIYNGKKINIETFNMLDNSKTIKDRIASAIKVLPEYLFFDKELEINTKQIKVTNILDLIINSDSIDILNDELKIEIDKNILQDWISYNKNLEDIFKNIKERNKDDNKSNIEDLYTFSDLSKYDKIVNEKTFGNIFLNKKTYVKEKENKTEKFIHKVEKQTREYKEFDSIEEKKSDKEGIIKKGSTISIEFKHDIEIFELFNKIILDERISFVKCNNFFKILKNFNINQEWLYDDNEDIDKTDIMTLYIYIKKEMNDYTNKDYIPVDIKISNNVIISILSVDYINDNITNDEIAEEIKKILRIEEAMYEIKEQVLRGSFNVYDSFINYHVLAELAMNDNIMSSLIYIDESSKATKSRIFVYFRESVLNSVTVEISNHKKSVDDIKNEIFISGKDEQTLMYYKNIFVKICYYYQTKMEDINEMYQYLLDDDDFGAILIEEQEEKHSMMRDIDKDVFVPGYVKQCEKKRTPQEIKEEELKDYTEYTNDNNSGKKQTYIKFPRDTQKTGITFASDGKNQKYYTCSNNNNGYVNIGLQKNNLENFKEYPYLPCCFSNSQKGGIISNYYENNITEIKNTIPTKQQKIIVTNKILNDNALGFLPPKLNKLFSLLYQDNDYHFLRFGSIFSNRSFLICLIKNYIKTKENKKNTVITEEYLSNFINKNIINSDVIYTSRQSIYDKDIEQIKTNIKNPELYFDPRLYTQLLENIFKINIILFNEDGMFSPRYSKYYHKFINNNNCIFIYEHMGAESDRSKFPQCEIICRTGVSKHSQVLDLEFDLQNSKSPTYKISKNISTLYKQFVPVNYLLNNFNKNKFKIIGQIIDYYGKTRQINIKHNDINMTLYTTPICPLNIKEEKSDILHISDLKQALDFCNELNIKISSQVIINNNLTELICLWDTIEISIPIKDNTNITLDNIYIREKELNYFKKSNSYLELYNNNQKIANYLLEYTYYLFSKYLHNNNKIDIQKTDFDFFSKNSFVINTNHQYIINKPILFSNISDNVFLRNNKLIVTSEEMIKKLLYSLKLFSIRNINELKDYKNKISIKKYYNYISDFTEHPSQIILYNKDSVIDWINQKSTIHYLYKSTNSNIKFLNYNEPYYINFENNTFLAVNSNQLNKALDISSTWINDKYNKNIFSNSNISFKNTPYNLYIYIIDKFVLNKINGGNNTINILTHRNNNNDIIYTSLLIL